MKPPVYDSAAPPSTFEHRGDECIDHGPNVPHFRVKGEPGPFYCVACAQEQLAAEPVSGVRAKSNGHGTDYAGLCTALEADLHTARRAQLDTHEALDAANATIAALQAKLAQATSEAGLAGYWREQAESKRVERFWHTFDAVIASGRTVGQADAIATEVHGPIETKPEGA